MPENQISLNLGFVYLSSHPLPDLSDLIKRNIIKQSVFLA